MKETDAPEKVVDLCGGLLTALEDIDRAHPPYGLYASDELVTTNPRRHYFQEWHRGLAPYLESTGAKISLVTPALRHQTASFSFPGIGRSRLRLLTLSKIKVRKYGSRYRVDKHESFDERWRESDLARIISKLWKQPEPYDVGTPLGIVIFLGYDKAQRPFETELTQLEKSLRWTQRGVLYLTRSWPDLYGRGFGIRTSVWGRYSEAGVASW